ncbi:MAG: DUF4340 domain-containing protein [Gemmatimonadales bacterium]|nr:DUF4340 domain-containing protein [Gemmatimonadales bacterium]
MIKTKNLVILFVVLAVLIGVSLIQKASHKKSVSGSSVTVVLEGAVAKEDLSRITVSYGLNIDVVDLVATPEGWLVATSWNAKAGEQKIDTLLRNLENLSGEFRSDKESVVADYGLGSDNSVRIRAFGPGGDEVLALDIGNKSERSPGNFIKSPDNPSVFLTQQSVLTHLGIYDGPALPKSTHFVDLQAVKEDRLAVDRIILRDGDELLDMAKEFAVEIPAEDDTTGAEPTVDRLTWEWKLIAPQAKALAKTKADGVLSALVNIRAVDVGDPAAGSEAFGLAEPTRVATLFLEDGREVILEFGSAREADGDKPAGTWMKVQGEESIWTVTEYAVNNAFKKLEDLLPEE